MSYVNPEFLISPNELTEAIDSDEGDLRIFDTTVFLHPDPPRYRIESGQARYDEGHIPGAGFLDLTGALSDGGSRFAFTMPAPDALAATFAAAGIDDDSRVVLYSSGHVMWATRVWWMLTSLGHERVAVLDGGYRAWLDDERPVETAPANYAPGAFRSRFRPAAWVTTTEVREAIGSSSTCTVNALSAEVYSGEGPLNYGRPGHIAGSRSVPYDALLTGGRFRDAAEIGSALDAKGLRQAERVICYCGGGISATVDAFALRLLGHPNVAVYDGSMSEWASDPDLPMETGPDA